MYVKICFINNAQSYIFVVKNILMFIFAFLCKHEKNTFSIKKKIQTRQVTNTFIVLVHSERIIQQQVSEILLYACHYSY